MAYRFVTVDYPDVSLPRAPDSYATGVNDAGTIVGGAHFASGPHSWQGYIDSDGSFERLNAGPGSTIPNDVNSYGTVVGWNEGTHSAFRYEDGTYSQINGLNSATGNNDYGQIVGVSGTHGVLKAGGHATNVDMLGATSTIPEDITNTGRIVGYYATADGATHGFVGKPGHLRTLDVPGAASTKAYAGNDKGDVVGLYTGPDERTHGFLNTNGHFTTFDVPGATRTDLAGINNKGEIVGSFTDSAGHQHSFLAADILNKMAGHPEMQRDLRPGWVEAKDTQREAYGGTWDEQHPAGPAMIGAVATQDVAAPFPIASH